MDLNILNDKNPLLPTRVYSSAIWNDWTSVIEDQKIILLKNNHFTCMKCKQNNVDKDIKRIGNYKTVQLLYRRTYCNTCEKNM